MDKQAEQELVGLMTRPNDDSAQKRDVLLLVDNDFAAVKVFERLAELMLHAPDMRPVIFVDETICAKAHVGMPAFCQERGIELLTAADFSHGDGAEALSFQPRSLRRWLAWFFAETVPRLTQRYLGRPFTAVDTNGIAILGSLMLRRAAVCEAVFSQRRYATLVIPEDNIELDTAVWVAIARRHGVRVVIVPYTMSNTLEFVESFVRHPPFQVEASARNRLAAWLFPRWTMRYKGRHFLRVQAARIFVAEMWGLTPPNPWLMNSGHADAIAVESVAMHEYCLEGGHPERQLRITGSQTDDVIAEVLAAAPQRRSEFLTSLGLPDDRPILLFALPPNQKTFDRPGCEFSSWDDLLQFWAECISEIKDWNVIVRPHPKEEPEYLEAMRRHGLSLIFGDTATLVPLCDLYVASISATIRWAIACGKPVINYDVYQYNYGDYDGVPGVAYVTKRNEFRDLLQSLTTDSSRRAKLVALQQREAERWGKLDGMSGQRILALVRDGELPEAYAATTRGRFDATIGDVSRVGS